MICHLIRSSRKLLLGKTRLLYASERIFSLNRKFSIDKINNEMEKIIAIGQMCATNNKIANRQQVQEIVNSAVEQNACFVFLPECCDYVGNNRDETLALAESLGGETIKFYQRLAKENNIWLSLGGVHELIPDKNNTNSKKLHNSHIVIADSGELKAVYRKLHLFDVETSEFRFQESSVIDGGNSVVSPLNNSPLDGGLGLLICYDLRFPEVSTILRKKGATFLTYPSAFSYPTGVVHWKSLLRARAIENQCFVIAAAQAGYHNEKRRSYGHAMVVDPWGEVLLECDDLPVPQCKTIKISLDTLQTVRRQLPCFDHRRDDVYSVIPLQMTSPAKSIVGVSKDSEEVPIEKEEIPYFAFEKNSVPKSTTFLDSPLSIAFTNVTCVVPGHVLVASRRCVARLKDLKPDEIIDFFMTVCKCQRLLEQHYGTNASTVTVQDGECAGQTVKHVHCHIMPRKEGDFEHNDQIYIELNRHDHPVGEKRKYRSIEERTAEANEYRKLLATFQMFPNSIEK